MSSNCILVWSSYVVLSFILSVCINAHCHTVPSSCILPSEPASVQCSLLFLISWWHMSDIEYPLRWTRCAFIRLTTVNVQSDSINHDSVYCPYHDPKCIIIFLLWEGCKFIKRTVKFLQQCQMVLLQSFIHNIHAWVKTCNKKQSIDNKV